MAAKKRKRGAYISPNGYRRMSKSTGTGISVQEYGIFSPKEVRFFLFGCNMQHFASSSD
jgi:hypothetical protein